MKLISVGKGLFTKVDDSHYDFLTRFLWHTRTTARGTVYVRRRQQLPNGKTQLVQMHRTVLELEPEDKELVDHINRDTLDNQEHNLRKVSHAQNAKNRNSLGVRYIPSRKKPWRADLRIGTTYLLERYFATREEAVAARVAAEQKYFGEYAPQRNLVEQI